MAITIELPPEVEAHLAELARWRRLDVEACARSLLVAAIGFQPVPGEGSFESDQKLEEFRREMSQFAHKVPLLPDETFSRESIYQDHD